MRKMVDADVLAAFVQCAFANDRHVCRCPSSTLVTDTVTSARIKSEESGEKKS